MDVEKIKKLRNDLKKGIVVLHGKEARYLVDLFYQIQDFRLGIDNRVRSIDKPVYYNSKGNKRQPTKAEKASYIPEPHEFLISVFEEFESFEKDIKDMLTSYVKSQQIWSWLSEVKGIGPILAAGLIAHIDITKCPTAGHIWSYAGLNPLQEWLAGQKRPFNASLKVICWKIGQSFVKQIGNPDAVYTHLYLKRKAYEEEKNVNGDYSDQAKTKLKKYNIGKTTDAWLWYSGCFTKETAIKIISIERDDEKQAIMDKYDLLLEGKKGDAKKEITKERTKEKAALQEEIKVEKREIMDTMVKKPGEGIQMLPPAHIQQRCERYATKIFLSHLHEVWYEMHFGEKPPAPYPIAILGHAHKIEPK